MIEQYSMATVLTVIKSKNMKTFIVVIAVAIFIIVLFQSYTISSANKTEEQKYTVILKK